MSAVIMFISIFLMYILPYTQSQQQPSCYYYGCGFYSTSQLCQCNPSCESFGDCCDDFNELCKNGYFEECPHSPFIKQDRRPNKQILTVVSFNIEWLFLTYQHSMGQLYCPGEGCDWKNTSAAYTHMHTVATYMDQFNADIILLHETCDCWTMQQLINDMPVNGHHYKVYLLRGTD
eukprot:890525_1